MKKKLTIDKQENLLNKSIEQHLDFSELLNDQELSYDDLSYTQDDYIPKECLEKIECLDDIPKAQDNIPAVSFFSGAGGLDIGFSYAGIQTKISIEFNETFCNTLRKNDPSKIVIGPPNYSGDISKREELAKILAENGISENFEGVFHGGPPCQSFSIAANQRFNK